MVKSASPWIAPLFFIGLLLCVGTGLHNIGIIALDDYSNGIGVMIPAQLQQPWWEIAQAHGGVHPWIPQVLLAKLAKLALALGAQSPVWQLRLVLGLLGALVFTFNAVFAMRHFRLPNTTERERLVVLFLISFYFVCPLFFSRPMIESLSMPFLTASAYFACEYHARKRASSLLWALFALTLASLFRFQAGVCVLALIAIVAMGRNRKHLVLLALGGAVAFVATGLLDWWVRGGFHTSLLTYLEYNAHAGDRHGRMPFYVFPALIFGLTLPPAFLSRYRGLDWRKAYGPLLPTLLYFVIFVLAHTLSPHKEERFFVPVIPLFLILLTPLAAYLITAARQRWRVIYFVGLNAILLFFTSVNVPQWNVISMALFLDHNPEIQSVAALDDSVGFFPSAFLRRSVAIHSVSRAQLTLPPPQNCGELVVIRFDKRDAIPSLHDYEKVASFSPGFPEDLFVKLNPKQNTRRGPLDAFLPRACVTRFDVVR